MSARVRVLKRGKAVYLSKLSVIDCTVRDMSDGGARLACHHAGFLPEEFLLVLMLDRTMRRVRVKWRRLNEVGVQYHSEAVDASQLKFLWPTRPPFLLRIADMRHVEIVLCR